MMAELISVLQRILEVIRSLDFSFYLAIVLDMPFIRNFGTGNRKHTMHHLISTRNVGTGNRKHTIHHLISTNS